MVPGSTFRYGSSFCMLTRSPRSLSSLPMLEAVSPLPRLEATPPVTKRCLVVAGRDPYADIANAAPVVRFGGNPARPRGIRISRHGGARGADTVAATSELDYLRS